MHMKQVGVYYISSLFTQWFLALAFLYCIRAFTWWRYMLYGIGKQASRWSGLATGQFDPEMHEFYVKKNTSWKVRRFLHAKSQASNWLPEGDGYLVFSSHPTGEPLMADPVKLEYQWARLEIESTLRQWFLFMVVDCGLIENSWYYSYWMAGYLGSAAPWWWH